jgi:outer membrane receptor protein involved in Fe transport
MNLAGYAAVVLVCLGVLQGQVPAGEIRVEVQDPSGRPMEASGRLQNVATGADRVFQTDALGVYTFTGVPWGAYRLNVSRDGFLTQTVTVDVRSEKPVLRTVKLALALGPQSKVEVVGTMPLPGVDLSADQVAAPVQTAEQADIGKSGALDLPDFMSRRLNGVYLNEMQGNPFQADLNYRGYTASPLLGTPQGLSIYVDGVRQNQPFGDVVSWDLIQNNAIESMTLMPGSDPLFGLNTLGGAVSIQNRDGAGIAGPAGRITYGSSGRKALEAEYGGGSATGFNWFFAANAFHESGWRTDSPSDVRQAFVKPAWKTDKTSLALTLAYAYNTLTGNGLQDYRLLARSYSSVYTIPDTVGNRSRSLNFSARHTAGAAVTFSGNVYYRNIRTEGVNGNANTDSFDQSVYQPNNADQAALSAAGYTGFPSSGATAANTPFPKWRCIAQALESNAPAEKCDAVIVDSKTVQNNYGVSGQVTWFSSHHNQLTAGAGFDGGRVNYTQNTQFGYLNPDYTITGVNAWQDGTTTANGAPVDARVNLHGTNTNSSVFAAETLSLGKAWSLTLSGRYNRSTIDNSDRISPVTGPGSLNGSFAFRRFNPSVGVTWSPVAALNAYVSYAEGSRAPTSIELGCADPDNPCSLPNALTSDPPLRQVVTGTWEAGLRGRAEAWLPGNLTWNIGAFRAENRDDILFVASEQTGSGFFRNFGRTRRQGFDAGLKDRIGPVNAGLDYTFLEATYESTEMVNGAANDTSDTALAGEPGIEGVIAIHAGNRIPLVPKQTGKFFADWQATPKLLLDLSVVAASSSYARGNENNAYRADGKYYLGPGVSPGYAVFNLRAHYDLTRKLRILGQVDNLFDRHYYTAAQLANTGFTSQGAFIARPFPADRNGNFPAQSATFFAPGAPRRIWVELGFRF